MKPRAAVRRIVRQGRCPVCGGPCAWRCVYCGVRSHSVTCTEHRDLPRLDPDFWKLSPFR